MNKKQLMYQRVTEHGENLKLIFGLPKETDPIKLCKSLLRLENKAHHATTCLCNTNTMHLLELNQCTGYDVKQATEEEQDKFFNDILKKACKILNIKPSSNQCSDDTYPIFINHDPRGYALKIRETYTAERCLKIEKDWGGYGIIAPDFREV